MYHLLIKLLESFSTFCNTISLLPSTHNMSKFVAMLQDRVTRKKSPQTSNETLLHVISEGKCKHNGNSNKPNPRLANNQPISNSLIIIVITKATFSPTVAKRKETMPRHLLLPKLSLPQNQTQPTQPKKQFSLALKNILHIWLDQLPQPLMSG